MSLRLLVDEDTQAKILVRLLRQAGHDVITVGEASLETALDDEILDYARTENRVVLTHNCEDFLNLHDADPRHPGILAIYEDQDTSKNMTYAAIVRAVGNVEAALGDCAGQFLALNAWNY